MEKRKQQIHRCSETKEAECHKEKRQEEVLDPRSFCHNISSKPDHICGKSSCHQFLDENKSGAVVCIPEELCTLKRRFGPSDLSENALKKENEDDDSDEESDDNLASGDKDAVDEVKYQKKGDRVIATQKVQSNVRKTPEQEKENDANDKMKQIRREEKANKIRKTKETKELLETLGKTLDPEEMAAITALAGADICPCCKCTVCECKLRGVSKEKLMKAQKQAEVQKQKKLRERRSKEKNSLEEIVLEKGVLDKGVLEKGVLEKGVLEKGVLEKGVLEKGVLEKGVLEKSTLEKNALEINALKKISLEKSTLDEGPLEKMALEKQSLERGAPRETSAVEETLITKKAQGVLEQQKQALLGTLANGTQEERKRASAELAALGISEIQQQAFLEQIPEGTTQKIAEEYKQENIAEIIKQKHQDVQAQKAAMEKFNRGTSEDRNRSFMELRAIGIAKDADFQFSFDYFENPDMTAFEKEQLIKLEQERIQAFEEEKLQLEREQEEREMRKQKEREALAKQTIIGQTPAIEIKKEAEIQAKPETSEEASQFYGKTQKKDLAEHYHEVPLLEDRVEEWRKPEVAEQVKPDEWTEYKVAEWAGIRHQDAPTVIETVTAEGRSSVIKSEPTSPPGGQRIFSRSTGPPIPKAPLPLINLQDHAFDRSWLEEAVRKSADLATKAKLQKTETKPTPISDALSGKLTELEVGKEVLVASSTLRKEPPSAAETIALMQEAADSEREERKSQISDNTPPMSEAEKLKLAKERAHAAICECIPGFCTCAGTHYLFKKKPDQEDFGMGFKPLQVDVIVPSTTQERHIMRLDKERKVEVSPDTSCSCIHSASALELTPVVSRIEVTAKPPTALFSRRRQLLGCTPPRYQTTLIIVKPEAVKFKDVILRAIKKEGLDIISERIIRLTPEQVSEIYTENYGSSYFPLFIQQLSSSPILLLCISGINAIQRWSEAIGPEKQISTSWFYPPSIKRRFGIHKDVFDVMRLSDDFIRAKTEVKYFFPLNILEPILIDSLAVQDYCDKYIHPTLLKGLHEVIRGRPVDPLLFLAEWLLLNNPYQPYYKQIHVALAPI